MDGAELRMDMLFFHEVPIAAREAATARLAALVREALPRGALHGPLLLCGRMPPPSTAEQSGFACIGLDADAAALRRSLQRVVGGPAAKEAAERKALGAQLLRDSQRLHAILGCEQVRWVDRVSTLQAAAMCRALLPHAAGLPPAPLAVGLSASSAAPTSRDKINPREL